MLKSCTYSSWKILFLVQEWAKYELMINVFDMTIVYNLITLLMSESVFITYIPFPFKEK